MDEEHDWDAYWTKQLASDYWQRSHRCRLSLSPFLRYVEELELTGHRVLVVGCGISTEPALLAHLGYEVVAFDVSPVAIDHIRAHPATEGELSNWLVPHLPADSWGKHDGVPRFLLEGKAKIRALRKTLKQMSKAGGSLTTLCADVRTFVPDQPFDLVYSPWSWQCLSQPLRAELPKRIHGWLRPGGAAVIATQNVSHPLCDELVAVFAAAGLVRADEQTTRHELDAKRWFHFGASG